jgi:hypothetical protein
MYVHRAGYIDERVMYELLHINEQELVSGCLIRVGLAVEEVKGGRSFLSPYRTTEVLGVMIN